MEVLIVFSAELQTSEFCFTCTAILKPALFHKFICKAVETWDKFFCREKDELNGGFVPRRAHKSHFTLTVAETILFSAEVSSALMEPSAARPPHLDGVIGQLLWALMGLIYLGHTSYFSCLPKSFIKGILASVPLRFSSLCYKGDSGGQSRECPALGGLGEPGAQS